MRTPYLLTLFVALFLSSCSSNYYYQVYKVDPVKDIEYKSNSLIYENDDCIVYYNLWENGGNIGFNFYNKTSKNLYLNLKESFFILNGEAFDYYKNRVYTNKLSQKLSSEFVISYNEPDIICIPAYSSKNIAEYDINNVLYRDCDLYRFPSKKQVKTVSFNKENSPFVFSNRIAYYIDSKENSTHFENEFFVTEITNYPENQVIEERPELFCEQEGKKEMKFFKNETPFQFYIRYNKNNDSWKH